MAYAPAVPWTLAEPAEHVADIPFPRRFVPRVRLGNALPQFSAERQTPEELAPAVELLAQHVLQAPQWWRDRYLSPNEAKRLRSELTWALQTLQSYSTGAEYEENPNWMDLLRVTLRARWIAGAVPGSVGREQAWLGFASSKVEWDAQTAVAHLASAHFDGTPAGGFTVGPPFHFAVGLRPASYRCSLHVSTVRWEEASSRHRAPLVLDTRMVVLNLARSVDALIGNESDAAWWQAAAEGLRYRGEL